jgi:hypothetical protein
MMDYETRGCCICGPSTPVEFGVDAQIPAETLGLEQLQNQWNGFFKDAKAGRSFFSYQRCRQCDLLFCPSYFYPAQLSHLYANMPDNTANVDLSSLEKTQYGYFKTLVPYLDQLQGDYFEMGPDIGLFTQHAIQSKIFDKYWLAEPNKAVWPQLKQVCGTQAHSLFSDMLLEDPIPNPTIAVAVMIHVLDHVLNPVQVLQHLHAKMREGAMVLIVTHDESSLLAKLLKHRWPAYCLQHPQLYRPTSMTQLLNKAGFEVLDIQKTYNHFPLGYLFNHLFWALGIKKQLFPPLNAIQLPLKLGNMITIAKKRSNTQWS